MFPCKFLFEICIQLSLVYKSGILSYFLSFVGLHSQPAFNSNAFMYTVLASVRWRGGGGGLRWHQHREVLFSTL